ncbi:hypothetical protein C8R44DRAFT_228495 [Mycena epipterygia]|nr:hypothetical protein C8R44DRAFT_228495 [Mycena epipterygia]
MTTVLRYVSSSQTIHNASSENTQIRARIWQGILSNLGTGSALSSGFPVLLSPAELDVYGSGGNLRPAAPPREFAAYPLVRPSSQARLSTPASNSCGASLFLFASLPFSLHPSLYLWYLQKRAM